MNAGASLTGVTVMVAAASPPPSPPASPASEACTLKLPAAVESGDGVNRSPAEPSANVMKAPSAIGVTPSFWNSVPLAMPVIRKWVTSAPSAGFLDNTSPDVVWVSSGVVALVTEGVSATGATTTSKLRVCVSLAVSVARTVTVAVPQASASGVTVTTHGSLAEIAALTMSAGTTPSMVTLATGSPSTSSGVTVTGTPNAPASSATDWSAIGAICGGDAARTSAHPTARTKTQPTRIRAGVGAIAEGRSQHVTPRAGA